ncbi:hypothetical protein EJ05DRAFT_483787 [Pseudovirgaria hyperparasitica]|uniref:Mitochondrial adapter protein MCP1 transmembrane domain-containing protein n=1 Tax=Pseudovirgaria hyperparasitica TaxID=470096 RepID=A0A6A6WGT0_9PEZI|nr:uncharacterized protein EJ05DRAFT_483787 [Pseudovirgaria hyperparasitica]KAF2761419.1 hypothetical protein EJ05DRAFT_483787 [Pseudovirgaria hyperparasitica]
MSHHRPDSTGDGETPFGLTEVDPSPIEDTPYEVSSDSYFPQATSPPQSSTTSIFGLGNHGPAWYLIRAQKYSSYTFTVFAAFHVTNTAILPLITRSVTSSDKYLLLTRPYYQSFPLEALLIGIPAITHVAAGVALRLYRRSQSLGWYGAESRKDRRTIAWPKVSGISALGFALSPLVATHVFVTRVLPMYLHGDNSIINLSYVAHGFAKHPIASFVGYTALVGVGVFHAVWGWAKWQGWTPVQVTQGGPGGQLRSKRRWYSINGAAAALTGLWLAGGLVIVGRGGQARGWMAKEFDELYNHLPYLWRFSS